MHKHITVPLFSVFLLLVLVGSVAAGMFLLKQPQDIRQQAYPTDPCTPGQRKCEGNTVYVCTNSAGSYQRVTSCNANQVCRSGACEAREIPPTCTEGTFSCSGNTIVRCTSVGDYQQVRSCPNGYSCASGNCVANPAVSPPPVTSGGVGNCYGYAATHCPDDANRTCERECITNTSGGQYTSGACRGLTVSQCAALAQRNGWTTQYCSGTQDQHGIQMGEFTSCGGNSTGGCGQVDLLDSNGGVKGFVIDKTECNGGSGTGTGGAGAATPSAQPRILGDTNNNQRVEIFDLNNIIASFNRENCSVNQLSSCLIDIFDYNTVISEFRRQNQ